MISQFMILNRYVHVLHKLTFFNPLFKYLMQKMYLLAPSLIFPSRLNIYEMGNTAKHSVSIVSSTLEIRTAEIIRSKTEKAKNFPFAEK